MAVAHPTETWLPAGAVTGLGPLPQTDPDEAIRYLTRACPSVPFWPQLPQRGPGETSVAQALAPLADLVEPDRGAPWSYTLRPGATMDALLAALAEREPAIPGEVAGGLPAFERAFQEGRFPHAKAVKGQLIGPVSLAMRLHRGGPRGRPFADHPLLVRALGEYLTRLGQWQVQRLARLKRPVVLFVDEPLLGGTLTPAREAGVAPALAALSQLLAGLRQAGAVAGVRAAQPAGLHWLDEAAPDLWAFDAHHGLDQFAGSNAARGFVEQGGHVAFGLVPTGAALSGLTAEAMFTRWLQGASVLGDVTALARRSLITASCGLGRVDPPAASATFNFAHRVSYLVSWIASGHHSASPRSA